jgi:hypothetical protein
MKMGCKSSILVLLSKSLSKDSLFSMLTLRRARRQYYAANHIGWCARPPHGKEGFVRRGRFKKASNMNYCLDFSNRVEDGLLGLIAEREESTKSQNITLDEENKLYQQALETTINADQGRTMAAGNVRLGEIILLVDCDTRVVSLTIVLNQVCRTKEMTA